MMTDDIKLSCIVTNYNARETIIQTLESVKNQTWIAWECIIVDDCSTDDSVVLIRDFIKGDPRFTLYSSPENRKQAYCWNLGISKAACNYIVLIDSDDMFHPYAFEKRAGVIRENPSYDVWLFPHVYRFEEKEGEIKILSATSHFSVNKREEILSDYLRHKLPLRWNTSSGIWRKASLLKLGGFSESLPRMVDADLYTRFLLTDMKYHETLGWTDFYYRITGSQADAQIKQEKFIQASFLYIRNSLQAAEGSSTVPYEYVKKNLRKLALHIYMITLFNNRYPKETTSDVLISAYENALLSENACRRLFKLKTGSINKFLNYRYVKSLVWILIHKLYIHR